MISNLPDSEMTLIDKLLSDQQQLHTPVVQISEKIDAGEIRTNTYKHLIPLSKPGAGQQYAFQVELDKCTSCKACVAACHSLNGLEEKEAWRDVGLLHGGDDAPGWQQTVTTACHHCLEPQCMHGCPVNAYEKDDETGIVRHLDDQCIGCEYCSLKCPYDVPKYSSRLGIVRKCDMCYQRLEVGEAPACVQACPNEAIKIITVDQAKLKPDLERGRGLITGAPLPNITQPTTQYIGREVPKTALPADLTKLTPAPTHEPLVGMLTLTQAGVGVLLAAIGLGNPIFSLMGTALFFIGLSFSILHLGRPLGAWRFFVNLKKSWLSREILTFSLFAPFAILLPVIHILLSWQDHLGDAQIIDTLTSLAQTAKFPVEIATATLGLVAVFTSVMIYHDTQRTNWNLRWTIPAFYGTTLAFVGASLGSLYAPLCLIPLLVDGINLLPAIKEEKSGKRNPNWTPALHRSRLMWTPLKKITTARLTLGSLAFLLAFVTPYLAIPLLIGGELLSRVLYFKAVHSPKMPGQF